MYMHNHDHLEVLTRSYWMLASAKAGRSDLPITVELAIQTVNVLESNLGPHRQLLRSVKVLSNLIIEGKPKSGKKAVVAKLHPSNVLQMLRKQ